MSVPLIELSNVTIVRGDRPVLRSVSFQIDQGEHVAILGPNGCGKSTLIRTLTRELYPFGGRGSVRICGRDRWVISELRTLIGVVSEEPRGGFLGEPTGLDMAVSGLIGTYGVLLQHDVTPELIELGHEALDRVEAGHLAPQPVETMSTGERRRVFIARALVSKPLALVLDEPTSGLDMKAAREFQLTIRRLAGAGTTIVLVTHHLDEVVPEFERIVLLKDGAVFADGPRSEVFTPKWLSDLFGMEVSFDP